MTGSKRCPVCDGQPRVLVAIAHPSMRRYTRELLVGEYHCWVATEVGTGQPLDAAIATIRPDLLVVDTPDVTTCFARTLAAGPAPKVVVIGPEPDSSYRAAAINGGAAAWIPRERVADDLGPEMRRLLGCIHDPCPDDHPAATGLVSTHSSGGSSARSGAVRSSPQRDPLLPRMAVEPVLRTVRARQEGDSDDVVEW